MLKKTLYTAVAAIAVSTTCLSTAEAKEDLVLEMEGSKFYTVGNWSAAVGPRVSGQQRELRETGFHFGTANFDGKVIDTYWNERTATEWISGSHALCGPGTQAWTPWESSWLFRGSNPENTLTMDTVSLEDSSDPYNMDASVLCWDGQRTASAAWMYRISNATGKWRCAYTRDNLGIYSQGELPPPAESWKNRPFGSYIYFDRVEGLSQGAIIIPRPCEQ